MSAPQPPLEACAVIHYRTSGTGAGPAVRMTSSQLSPPFFWQIPGETLGDIARHLLLFSGSSTEVGIAAKDGALLATGTDLSASFPIVRISPAADTQTKIQVTSEGPPEKTSTPLQRPWPQPKDARPCLANPPCASGPHDSVIQPVFAKHLPHAQQDGHGEGAGVPLPPGQEGQ